MKFFDFARPMILTEQSDAVCDVAPVPISKAFVGGIVPGVLRCVVVDLYASTSIGMLSSNGPIGRELFVKLFIRMLSLVWPLFLWTA